MTKDKILRILKQVNCTGFLFQVGDMGEGFYLQVIQYIPEGDKMTEQKGRKWYISSYSIGSEVVQTAFKAVMTFAEHELREMFTYQGRQIFSPHFNLDALVRFADAKNARARRK